MAEASIPVDLLNPGQVFACLGLMEAAEVLLGGAEGAFDWSGAAEVFRLAATGDENPVAHVLKFLAQAKAVALVPPGSRHDTGKWSVPSRAAEGVDIFPFPEPDSPATLPCLLESPGGQLILDHWGDATRRDNVKFWAGSGGYPGAALARDAVALLQGAEAVVAEDPFAFKARQTSSFRFDWRRDYVPVTTGFSPNKHAAVEMVGYPLVELLAALCMGCARPKRVDKLTYRYSVVGPVGGALLPPMLLRAALGAVAPPFPGSPFRHFRMRLDWPGQEDQARAITEVVEETET